MKQQLMQYRRLQLADLDSYFKNRLRALKNAPSAFLTTYEEALASDNSHYQQTLAHVGNEKVIFGALVNGEVVATLVTGSTLMTAT